MATATLISPAVAQTAQARRDQANTIRVNASKSDYVKPIPAQNPNGDEAAYASANYYANFSKGLPHNQFGEVDSNAYNSLLNAVTTGTPSDFDAIPLGWPKGPAQSKLVDPQAGLAFDLECPDSHAYSLPAPPAFGSKEEVSEIAENYWMALTRNIPFIDYPNNALIAAAAADLSRYSAFTGPKQGGVVTPATVFRGFTDGDVAGPLLSQFLVRSIPYGAQTTPASVKFALRGNTDYLTDPSEWLDVQKGKDPGVTPLPVDDPFLMFNSRQLAQYVHIDELFQGYLNACLLLITPVNRGGFNAPINPGNPYKGFDPVTKTARYSNQAGFGTLGEPNFKTMVAEVATRALKAAWYQKWFVHRRLRPEAFAGRIHHNIVNGRSYQFDGPEFAKLQSDLLPRIFAANGNKSYMLPMAYPEGCPLHPSYAAGHATVAGACVTMLKAIFYEDALLSDLGVEILEPVFDGKNTQHYQGADKDALTIGGELNKLASNIGLARNYAGVHWRTDYKASLLLGEQIAIDYLTETVNTYNEDVTFNFHRFNNSPVKISK